VAALVIAEQDNPPRQYPIRADRILAMHRCLGVAGAETKLVQPWSKVAAGGDPDGDEQASADAGRSVADLCREWKIVAAKLNYDLACLPEADTLKDDSDATDKLCEAANGRQHEIEEELGARKLATVSECEGVIGVILKNLIEYDVIEDHDRSMLRNILRALQDMRIEAKRTAPA
jgi:hypothetical protein